MKKFISMMILPLFLAACPGSNGLQEEQLTTEYKAPAPAAAPVATATPADLTPDYMMAAAPKYFVGTEYKIDGVSYLPAEDMNYNEAGMAGIIPAELNGNTTTNGEVFDNAKLFATHKTLPLPSIVKITNLDNGASTLARVNNRGPFVNHRTMDVSQAVAAKLGMTGPTNVQITIQPTESAEVKAATMGTIEPTTDTAITTTAPGATPAATGNYAVQVGAFYSRESADAVAGRIAHAGNVAVVEEGGMFKVRVVDLSAEAAKTAMDAVRSENSAPGLLENGRWINPDSI